jgi:hypothetical protein
LQRQAEISVSQQRNHFTRLTTELSIQDIQLAEYSSIKAMTINGFVRARLEKKRCLIKPVRMVVMGGLEPPTPAL